MNKSFLQRGLALSAPLFSLRLTPTQVHGFHLVPLKA
jgi:hypothetical protein